MSLTEDLVPAPYGAHSTVGRATNRGMDKMRAIAIELEEQSKQTLEARKEAAERIAAERAQASTGKGVKPVAKTAAAAVASSPAGARSSSTPAPTAQDDMPASKKKPTAGVPKGGVAAQDQHSTPTGRAGRPSLNLGDGLGKAADVQSPSGLSLLPDSEAGREASPPKARRDVKPSIAFTSVSAANQIFSETSRSLDKRFFIQGASWEPNPEGGHYKVNDKFLGSRVLGMDFGDRVKHPSRAVMETLDKSRELGPEDLTSLDATFTKSGSQFCQPSMFSTVTMSTHLASLSDTSMSSSKSWKGQSLMSTATARPGLNNMVGSHMAYNSRIVVNQASGGEDWDTQDLNTSGVSRPRDTNLKNQLGRKNNFGCDQCQFFEAGKYAVNHDVVMPKAKKALGFQHQMSRSSPAFFQRPLGCLDEKGTVNIPDRSQYRHAPANRRRITHVLDMSQDLDRPPPFKKAEVLHDESDPEVSRVVHERAMTFDADTVGRAVERRRDYTLNMSREIPRERAGHGSRIAMNDICIRTKQGHTGIETTGQFNSTMETLKDSCSRRGDLGMTFDQHKARNPTRLKAAYSSLHRPRDHAAPEFSRTPPISGFNTRTPVKVLPRSRSHDAMPGWSAEAVDGILSM